MGRLYWQIIESITSTVIIKNSSRRLSLSQLYYKESKSEECETQMIQYAVIHNRTD